LRFAEKLTVRFSGEVAGEKGDRFGFLQENQMKMNDFSKACHE
jgi:hypothetical protein